MRRLLERSGVILAQRKRGSSSRKVKDIFTLLIRRDATGSMLEGRE